MSDVSIATLQAVTFASETSFNFAGNILWMRIRELSRRMHVPLAMSLRVMIPLPLPGTCSTLKRPKPGFEETSGAGSATIGSKA